MTTHRHTLTRSLLAAGALSGLLLSSACSSSSSDTSKEAVTMTAEGAEVDTSLLAFTPDPVQIKKGQTVTWVAGDNIRHIVVQGTYEVGGDKLRTTEEDDKTFELTLTKKGEKVSHTYDTAGTFTYFCTIHKGMNGTVVVS